MDVFAVGKETNQSVAYTGTAGTTTAFRQVGGAVLVWATTDAYVVVGEGVTATTADLPLPAYTPVVLEVPVGTGAAWRVSAVQISSGGTVYAKPVLGTSK